MEGMQNIKNVEGVKSVDNPKENSITDPSSVENKNTLENFDMENFMAVGSRLYSVFAQTSLLEKPGMMSSGFQDVEEGFKQKNLEQMSFGFKNIGISLREMIEYPSRDTEDKVVLDQTRSRLEEFYTDCNKLLKLLTYETELKSVVSQILNNADDTIHFILRKKVESSY